MHWNIKRRRKGLLDLLKILTHDPAEVVFVT